MAVGEWSVRWGRAFGRATALLALCAGFGAGARAQAQAPAGAESATPPAFEVAITPYVWLPALSGNLDTPLPRIGDPGFDLSSGTVLSNLARVPVMINGEVRYGPVALSTDLVYAGIEQDISTRRGIFQGGHTILDATFITVLGLYRAVDTPTQTFDLGAGTRIWHFANKVSLDPGLLPGVIQSSRVTWVDPVLALRYSARLSPRFGVTLYGDVGGFNTGSRLTWQALGSVDYQASASTTLRAGWRYVYVDYGSDKLSVDVGFNGPFIGATFRF